MTDEENQAASQLADVLVPARMLIKKGICTYDELEAERLFAIKELSAVFPILARPGDDVVDEVNKIVRAYMTGDGEGVGDD